MKITTLLDENLSPKKDPIISVLVIIIIALLAWIILNPKIKTL
jgi:hypothetical protein